MTIATKSPVLIDPEAVKAALSCIIPNGQTFEIRALEATAPDDRRTLTYAGWFDDPAAARTPYFDTAYDINATEPVDTALTLDTLTQIIFTWDGVNGTVYRNGVQVLFEAMAGPIDYTATQDLTIGRRCVSSNNFYNGKMRCVRMWSRAITAAEVTQLYNGGSPKKYAQLNSSGNFFLLFP